MYPNYSRQGCYRSVDLRRYVRFRLPQLIGRRKRNDRWLVTVQPCGLFEDPQGCRRPKCLGMWPPL